MSRIEKYRGIIPAFYACYDEAGEINEARVRALAAHFLKKGVQGLYVGGSSGECIYQSVNDRKQLLEAVMREVGGKLTIIAHVACNNTRDSQELARHAASLGVDAIAAIPPIYFRLSEAAIADYWNDISAAAPETDFIIYNIPQLAGVSLTPALLRKMLENPRVIGVKNSSMPVQDIQIFRNLGNQDFIVFNGPDEQLFSGLAAGAEAGIGGTYGALPELYMEIYKAYQEKNLERGIALQDKACEMISALCAAKGHMYAVIKAALEAEGLQIGSVRKPLPALTEADRALVEHAVKLIADIRKEL